MTREQIESAREQGEKQKGLAIMGGIQGTFAGLQGLFGGEPGSDMSQLLGVTLASFSFQMLKI